MIVGVVAALRAEARALRPALTDEEAAEGHRMLLQISGVGAAAATRAAEQLMRAGAGALISWGVAGALDPAMPTGALCLPRAVLEPAGLQGAAGAAGVGLASGAGVGVGAGVGFATSAPWRGALRAALGHRNPCISEGTLLSGLDEALATPAAKRAAHLATGAVAVDMESVAIARVAARAALPFLVVRTVVDAASDAIPRSIVRASRAGPVSIGRLAAGLLAAPADLLDLWRLGRRYRAALQRLNEVARCGVPRPPARAPA